MIVDNVKSMCIMVVYSQYRVYINIDYNTFLKIRTQRRVTQNTRTLPIGLDHFYYNNYTKILLNIKHEVL